MRKVGVAILGLGTVGGGTYKVLTDHREFYMKNHNVEISVECVLEANRERALALGVDESMIAGNMAEICSNPDVSIVVETIGGVEPARTYVLAALNAGMSVVTSNEELYCKCGHELEGVAKKYNVGLYYGAACAGGIPVVRALTDNLQSNRIDSIIGIVNSASNYVLTEMASGVPYDDALSAAREAGYAHEDPSTDVEGHDSVYMLSILSSLAFHTKVPYTKIYREGIEGVSVTDIQYGKRLGYVLKFLAIGKDTPNGIDVRVHPAFLRQDHPLANVNGSYNAVFIKGDNVGDVMLYGHGMGELPTAGAIVGDVIYCATHANHPHPTFANTEDADPSTKFVTDFESSYYIRLDAEDETGVLSKVTSVFSRNGIGIDQTVQERSDGEGRSTLIFVTHPTREKKIRKAVDEINESPAAFANAVSLVRVV